MFKAMCGLWRGEAGFVLSAELILIATVVTLAMVVGLAEVSSAVNNEMGDMAGAVDGMSQDVWYEGQEEEYAYDHSGE